MEYKMIKSKKAFTMIELIFVIVIIGILASVAIPRLVATRDDAKITKTVSNLKVLLYDSFSFYTSQSESVWKISKWSDITDTVDSVQGSTSAYNTPIKLYGEDNVICFIITPNTDANGTVLTITSSNTSDIICSKAQQLAKEVGVLNDLSESTFKLGGQSISF
jgi:prepilin-type N-terminal cleavage/methylation domain-containing protein